MLALKGYIGTVGIKGCIYMILYIRDGGCVGVKGLYDIVFKGWWTCWR